MDLNAILNYWPYIVAGVIVLILYRKELLGAVSWVTNRKSAPTTEANPVSVGTLAEYLKAIRAKCVAVGDKPAADACDTIAPTLFHEKELATTAAAK